MTEQEAVERVRELLGPAADQLSDGDLLEAVRESVTFDSEGRRPSHPDWVPTYDALWAAGLATQMLAVKANLSGGIVRWTSEGTTVERRAPDFERAAWAFFRRSPLWKLTGQGAALGHIDITDDSDYDPASGVWPYGPDVQVWR